MPPYREFVKNSMAYPVSSFVSMAGISLPSSTGITLEEIDQVCSSFRDALKKYECVNSFTRTI
jgi:dTDP-4-amino-4,6-dideoxygalactose transaminase